MSGISIEYDGQLLGQVRQQTSIARDKEIIAPFVGVLADAVCAEQIISAVIVDFDMFLLQFGNTFAQDFHDIIRT